jgi:hypothetical protein
MKCRKRHREYRESSFASLGTRNCEGSVKGQVHERVSFRPWTEPSQFHSTRHHGSIGMSNNFSSA